MKSIKEYIQQFTLKERAILAEDIGYKLNYINRLAVDNQAPCSTRLAKMIQFCDFNTNLPVKMRLSPIDVENHKQLVKGSKEKIQ